MTPATSRGHRGMRKIPQLNAAMTAGNHREVLEVLDGWTRSVLAGVQDPSVRMGWMCLLAHLTDQVLTAAESGARPEPWFMQPAARWFDPAGPRPLPGIHAGGDAR